MKPKQSPQRLIPLSILILILSGFFSQSFAQSETLQLKGRILDEQGEPVDMLTIKIESNDQRRIYGAISNENGEFESSVLRGAYRLSLLFLSQSIYEQSVEVETDTLLSPIIIPRPALRAEAVIVQPDFITRQADRFTMNVSNSPLAIGRDGMDILQLAPGVITSPSGAISIYGRSGTRVMVNERLLPETGEDLVQYLRNVNAEDIQRIEVIPFSGAEYDASTTGGIIKITLKKKRDTGIEGAVTLRGNHSISDRNTWGITPSFNLKYRQKGLQLYTDVSYNHAKIINEFEEYNRFYDVEQTQQYSDGNRKDETDSWRTRLGATYDFKERHSVGIEGYYTNRQNKNLHLNQTSLDQLSGMTHVNSRYKGSNDQDRLSLSGNYIYDIDAKGSMFKIFVDYNYYKGINPTDYRSEYSGILNIDSVYNSYFHTTNHLYSATADLDLKLNDQSSLLTGLKYNRNTMSNTTAYNYFQGTDWHPIDPLSSINHYTENIGAVYVKYNYRFKNYLSLSFGLRGEYTYAKPRSNRVANITKQDYFGLFPEANIMIPVKKDFSHLLILTYNRKITRPGFDELNPYRIPLNEYTYVEGNPFLKPYHPNTFNLTWAYKQKYTLTAGYSLIRNAFAQIATADPDQSDIVIYRFEHINKSDYFYANLSVPYDPYPWWKITAQLSYFNNSTEMNDRTRRKNTFTGTVNSLFTIKKKWYLDLNLFYCSPILASNLVTDHMYRVDLALRRSFMNDRFTFSVGLHDLFESQNVKVRVDEPTYFRTTKQKNSFRTLSFSFRYNFKRGKAVKQKVVESGATDEVNRLNENVSDRE